MRRRSRKALAGLGGDNSKLLTWAALAAGGVGLFFLVRKMVEGGDESAGSGESGITEPTTTSQLTDFDAGSPAANGYANYTGTGYMGQGSGTESQYTEQASKDAEIAAAAAADPTTGPTPAAAVHIATPTTGPTLQQTDPKLLVKPLTKTSSIADHTRQVLLKRAQEHQAAAKKKSMVAQKERQKALKVKAASTPTSGGGMMTFLGPKP